MSRVNNMKKAAEFVEIKADLISDRRERRKEALKRIISLMTIGKDVSTLFTDVVNAMQTDRMEIKKLAYLYLMNYAKTNPELALLAVNTFVRDCSDPNPLIKALAVRTMGCINVDKITEYLCDPLRRCLSDEDPYVRKTAVICVAKLYTLDPILVEEQGFIDQLANLLTDSNPMVVANAVATFSEIAPYSPAAAEAFEMNASNVSRLLTAINECTEWGQVFILDALINYTASSVDEAKNICERITSRLSHNNSAVVLSTTKCLLKFSAQVTDNDAFIYNIHRKLSPPLITLLSAQPEIQYVALRNINLIVQKNFNILKNDIRAFFIKYNDPIYIKIEKLEIIIRLVDVENISLVLSELKEYATEVDVDFVKRSIRAIGRCALKVEMAADSCVNTLEDLIDGQVSYVVQECIVVLKDILRKYPGRFEGIILKLAECLDSLDDPEARSAMIWTLGEYSEKISNAGEVLRSFIAEGFFDESITVQLQLLTAVVKIFLKHPEDNHELVQQVLTMVTQSASHPDLRDRGYIYWRLLSNDPDAARDIVLSKKPEISDETNNLQGDLIDELILNMATLSSIYHKTPHTFIKHNVLGGKSPFDVGTGSKKAASEKKIKNVVNDLGNDLLLLDLDEPVYNAEEPPKNINTNTNTNTNANNENDLLFSLDVENKQPSRAVAQESLADLLGFGSSNQLNTNLNVSQTDFLFSNTGASNYNNVSQYKSPKKLFMTSEQGRGLEVFGTFEMRTGIPFLDLDMTNKSMASLTNVSFAMNKNIFGISVSPGAVFPVMIKQNEKFLVSVPLNFQGVPLHTQGAGQQNVVYNAIDMALTSSNGVSYFKAEFPLNYAFSSSGYAIDEASFNNAWDYFGKTVSEVADRVSVLGGCSLPEVSSKLRANGFLGPESFDNNRRFNAVLINNAGVLVKVTQTDGSTLSVSVRANVNNLPTQILTLIKNILN